MEESKIRESLKNNLKIFGEQLELIDTEYYLKGNQDTTRGFIDILAKDIEGNIVIIELKRSNQASRQAIHEVYKYFSGLQREKKISSKQIRAIIVSTEWRELLYPFSLLIEETTYRIEGFQLDIDEELKNMKATKIVPIQINQDFELSKKQDLLLYKTEEEMLKQLNKIKENQTKFILKDFFIIPLEKKAENWPFRYCLYICYRKYSLEKLYTIFKKVSSKKLYKFLEDYFENAYSEKFEIDIDYSEESGQNYENFHEKHFESFISSVENNQIKYFMHLNVNEDNLREEILEYLTVINRENIYNDTFEIGYAGKLLSMLNSEGWLMDRFVRVGIFNENDFLSDEALFLELINVDEEFYCNQSASSNKRKIEELFNKLLDKFFFRTNWSDSLREIIKRIKEYTDSYELSVLVYNSENILQSLLTRRLPYFEIVVDFGDKNEIYMGILELKDPIFNTSLNKIIKNIFDGDIMGLIFYNHFHMIAHEQEILKEIGLSQCVYMIENSDTKQYFKINPNCKMKLATSGKKISH